MWSYVQIKPILFALFFFGAMGVFTRSVWRLALSYPAQMTFFSLDRIFVRDLSVDALERHCGAPWSRLSDQVAMAATLSREMGSDSI